MKLGKLALVLSLLPLPLLAQQPQPEGVPIQLNSPLPQPPAQPQPAAPETAQPAPQENPLAPYQPSDTAPPEQAVPVSPDVSSYGQPAPRISPPPVAEYPPPQISFPDWLNQFRQDAIAQGVRAKTVYYALGTNVYPDESILEKDHAQPESKMTAAQYWDKLVDNQRIERGRQFYSANRETLGRVAETYSVRSKYIAALLGIESNYGDGQGHENIINALATLAYDGRRSEYFRGELINALRILDQGQLRLEEMKGSWAGAMGFCQFMPSSYIKYAQDFDNDGRADIWTSPTDAAASAANYLRQNGWKVAEGWGEEVQIPTTPVPTELVGAKVQKTFTEWRKLGIRRKNGKLVAKSTKLASFIQPDGPEGRAFLVTNNFHVLLRWNRSSYFAVAVGMLADAISKR